MADLTKTCNELITTEFSTGCNSEYYPTFPKYFIFGVAGTSITAVGDIPTPAEVQTYLNTGNAMLIPVTNGTVLAPELQTLTGADTFSNLTEVTREDNGVSGTIRAVTNATLEVFAQNNLNNRTAQFWWIDDEGKFYGEKTGFLVPFYIQNFQHDGFGGQVAIPIEIRWKRDVNKFFEFSNPNDDYLSLSNYSGVYTEVNVLTYSLGQVTGYSTISGWSKTGNPTVYAKIDTDVITFYPSDADRTAGTNALAEVDTTVDYTVSPLNVSGWGGYITFVAGDITDGSKWNVTYTS